MKNMLQNDEQNRFHEKHAREQFVGMDNHQHL